MEIEFFKMQSCGQDYILLDTLKYPDLNNAPLTDLAVQITSRRFGVGAEGLALIQTGTERKLKLTCLDPDGSAAVSSLFALRCAGRYAFDAGLVHGDCFAIETPQKIYDLDVIDSRNIIICSSPPQYWDHKTQLKERSDEEFTRSISIDDRVYNYTPVYLGCPHAVFFPPGYEHNDFLRKLKNSSGFAKDTTIDMVRVISREELSLRVWEMDSGENPASETGACASVVASVVNGLADRQVLVHLEVGNLFIHWSDEDNCLYVTGPADYVFTGTYYYEEGFEEET